MPAKTITPTQLAAMYQCPVETVDAMIRAGQIPSRRAGRDVEIPLRQLNAQLRRVSRYRIAGMLPIGGRPVLTVVKPSRARRRERPAA